MTDRRLTFEQFQVMSPAIYANFIPVNTAGLISDSYAESTIWFTKSFFLLLLFLGMVVTACKMVNGSVLLQKRMNVCMTILNQKSKGQKSLLVPYRNFFFILWIPANKSNSISLDFALSQTLTPNSFLHPVTLANSCHSRLILYRFQLLSSTLYTYHVVCFETPRTARTVLCMTSVRLSRASQKKRV